MTKEEAIDKVRAMKLSPGKDAELIIALHTLIPELRESEDERIRRTLVEYFGPKVQLDFVRGIPIQKIRDWLEKQKEQKQTDLPAGFYYIDLNGNRYYSKEFRYGDMKLKVGEQKPAWSEDIIRKAVKEIGLTQHQIDWFKTNVFPPKQEWSEEDEKLLNYAISMTDDAQVKNFLNSLRPSWKPSEEQMTMLRAIINDPNNAGAESCHLVMKSLYEQLEKL